MLNNKGMVVTVFVLMIFSLQQVNAVYSNDLSYTNLQSTKTNYNKFSGKYLLVDAMATWCGPCQKAMSHLSDVIKYRGSIITLFSLSISPNTDNPKALLDFKKFYNATWEFGIDSGNVFQSAYKISIIPTYVLFDQNGKVLVKFDARDVSQSADYIKYIDKYIPNNQTSNPPTIEIPFYKTPEFFYIFVALTSVILIIFILRLFRN